MQQKHLFSLLASLAILSTSAYASEYPTAIPPAPLKAIETTPTTPAPSTTPHTTAPATTTKNQHSETMGGYLGIGIDVLPKNVAAQMPTSVSAGQGIIVTRFAKNSPAEKSGIKANDILLAYDDTKIVHPQQFINLIRDDKPGRDVKITLLRNSKTITQNVTLGMQEIAPKSEIPANYTGLAINKIGDNTFDASIGIPMQNGSVQRRSFKGTREQIFQQVQNANLPPAQRNQLLFALQGGNQQNNNGMWNNMMPFGNNNGGNFFPFNRGNNGGNFFPFGNNNGGGSFPFNNGFGNGFNRGSNSNGGGFFPFGNNNGGSFPFSNGFNNGFNSGSNGGGFFPFGNNNNNGNNSYFPNMFGSKR